MHSTSIFLLAVGLLATLALARPGRRPSPGHHHEDTENEVSQEQNGGHSATFRVPQHIRLPAFLAAKLGRPRPTFTVKKIFNGKYLVVSPALVFKVKDVDSENGTSTTVDAESTTPRPTRPTTEEPETTTSDLSEESTTPDLSEESTTEANEVETTSAEEVDEESTTTEPEESGSTTTKPSFLKKRSFALNNNEELFFLED